MAQQKFLVTGATGATGGYVVERLLERGHAVRNGLFEEHCQPSQSNCKKEFSLERLRLLRRSAVGSQ